MWNFWNTDVNVELYLNIFLIKTIESAESKKRGRKGVDMGIENVLI